MSRVEQRKNKELVNAKSRKWYWAHRPQELLRRQKYIQEHREEINTNNTKYREEHPEQHREWYQKNSDREIKRVKDWSIKNKGRVAEWWKGYRKIATVRQTIRYRGLKEHLVALKGGKCERCGYSEYMGALEFHHIDPATKEGSKDWARRNFDLSKVILFCSNCHRYVHNGGNRV